MKPHKLRRFEYLENRMCLAVAAAVTDEGDLLVEGGSDGPVEILGTGEEGFEVYEDGELVAAVTGVTGGLRIQMIDEGTAAEDNVSVDLNGQAVDRVIADLGNGENHLVISDGVVEGGVHYVGGDDNDTLRIGSDLTTGGTVVARMGEGDNSLVVEGELGRHLFIGGGNGGDSVQITETAAVAGGVHGRLGDGMNRFAVAGSIEGHLRVRGGIDDDLVELLAGASVGRSVSVSAGDGSNALTIAGSVGRGLRYNGLGGDDVVNVADTASIAESATIRLGEGENTTTHAGDIMGDLRIASMNADDTDRVDLSMGVVGGETDLNLGGQTDPDDRPDRRGPRRFRGRGGR